MLVLTLAFWRNLAWSLFRTGLTASVVFIPGLVSDFAGTWLPWALTVGLTLVAAVATSFKGLPDPTGAPWWQVLVARTLRTFGQTVAGALTTAVMLTDVSWSIVLPAAASAALGTLVLTALIYLPQPTQAPLNVNDVLAPTLPPEAEETSLEPMTRASLRALNDRA